MVSAEAIFNSWDIQNSRPELMSSETSRRLTGFIRGVVDPLRRLSDKKQDAWLVGIGKGRVGEKSLAQFTATLLQIKDVGTRTDSLRVAFGEVFPEQSREKLDLVAQSFSSSMEVLREKHSWRDVSIEIKKLATILRLPNKEVMKLIQVCPEILKAKPWDGMESAPSSAPTAPNMTSSGSTPPPNRGFKGGLLEALKPHFAGWKHNVRLVGLAIASGIVGGLVLIGLARMGGNIAEHVEPPSLAGEPVLPKDIIAKKFPDSGADTYYGVELSYWERVIMNGELTGDDLKQKIEYFRTTSTANRAASLTALKDFLLDKSVDLTGLREKLKGFGYSAEDITTIMDFINQAQNNIGPDGLVNTNAFDLLYGISTPTPTPIRSPTPPATSTPKPSPTYQTPTPHAENYYQVRAKIAAARTSNTRKGRS